MGIDRKGGEIGVLPSKLVHVSAHDQGVEPHEGNPLLDLIICIRGRGQRGRDVVAGPVGHLFDAHDQRRFDLARGHAHQRGAKGSRAGGAGRLDLDRLVMPQAQPVGQERAELVLAVDQRGKHVPNVEGLNLFHRRVP